MDCIRICLKGHYHKKVFVIDCTPDEAMVFGIANQVVANAWMENFKPYEDWREENDKP